MAEVDHGSDPSDLVRSLLHPVELEGQECVASSHCVVYADTDLDEESVHWLLFSQTFFICIVQDLRVAAREIFKAGCDAGTLHSNFWRG